MQPMTNRPLWIGFLVGFLLGTIGLWVLALVSLALPPVEALSAPLFAPGRFAASLLQSGGSLGDGGVAVLFLGNGLLYGLLGLGAQAVLRRAE